VELVQILDKSCTQSVVGTKIMGSECDSEIDEQRPINFVVEGNADILFVHGVASQNVAKLCSITKHQPSCTELEIVAARGDQHIRYFGYGLVPSDAVDLIAFDSLGTQIYSGGDKITGTRDGDASPK
jgi:hypothetical protein